MRNGNHEQKSKYLPKLSTGELLGALAISEPGSGSDAMSMQTRADRKGDSYVLNGNKLWITNGPSADLVLVYAKTSADKISTFAVEKSTKGFSVA